MKQSISLFATIALAVVGVAGPAVSAAQPVVLDRGRLPPLPRFNLGQVASDTTACKDFNRFANQPWLDANAAATSTGASNIQQLADRSMAVQLQILDLARNPVDERSSAGRFPRRRRAIEHD